MLKLVRLIIIFSTIFWPILGLAYDDKTTHPALSDEMVDLFNLYYPAIKIDGQGKGLIKQGSIDEDLDARWMNHFYDPVYERGLWGYASSKTWAQNTTMQAILDPAYSGGSALDTVSS